MATARSSNGRRRKSADHTPPAIEGLEWGCNTREASVRYVWPGRLLAGSVHNLEGRKGVGKSTVLAALAAAVTGGPPLPGCKRFTPAAVLWAGGEDPWESICLPRLRQAGADLSRVARLQVPDSEGKLRRLMLPQDCEWLETAIRSVGARLLVIDPYGSAAAPGVNLTVEHEVRLMLEPLAEVAHRTGCTALLSRNLRKGTAGDIREQGLGSVGVGNVGRGILRCDEHPHEKGKYCLSVVCINWGRGAATEVYSFDGEDGKAPRILWHGASPLEADQIAEGRGTAAERDEWSDAEVLVCALIGSKRIPQTAISFEAQRAGVSTAMLRRVKASLRIESYRVQRGSEGHWEWGPPKAGWPAGLVELAKGGGVSRKDTRTLRTLPRKPRKKARANGQGAQGAQGASATPPPSNEVPADVPPAAETSPEEVNGHARD